MSILCDDMECNIIPNLGVHGLVYLPYWHTAVYMEKTEGRHAFSELPASHCGNSVCLETEACKKGVEETQNGNLFDLSINVKPSLVIWNFVRIFFNILAFPFSSLLHVHQGLHVPCNFLEYSLSCDYYVWGKLLYDGLCDIGCKWSWCIAWGKE